MPKGNPQGYFGKMSKRKAVGYEKMEEGMGEMSGIMEKSMKKKHLKEMAKRKKGM